jgi:hypothetical protein
MSRVLRVVGSVGVAVLVMVTIGWTSGRTTSASEDEDVASTTALDAAVASTRHDDDRPTVTLFADSLGFEAAQVVADQLGASVRFDSSSLPGVAMCDLIEALERAPEKAPDVAVVQFSGNNLTPCMHGADGQPLEDSALVDKYAADVETVIGILRTRGSRVVLAAAPRTAFSIKAEQVNTIFAWTAIRWQGHGEPVSYVDTAAPLLGADRSFTARLPCLPNESANQGCSPDGTITVRSGDGTHFCPLDTGGKTGCPVWSSGANRFGVALADAIRANLASACVKMARCPRRRSPASSSR